MISDASMFFFYWTHFMCLSVNVLILLNNLFAKQVWPYKSALTWVLELVIRAHSYTAAGHSCDSEGPVQKWAPRTSSWSSVKASARCTWNGSLLTYQFPPHKGAGKKIGIEVENWKIHVSKDSLIGEGKKKTNKARETSEHHQTDAN